MGGPTRTVGISAERLQIPVTDSRTNCGLKEFQQNELKLEIADQKDLCGTSADLCYELLE